MPAPYSRHNQSGAALVVALIILLVLTILGISAMNTTSLEEKMAANAQELTRAFHAADSGITRGYRSLDTTTLIGTQEGGTPVMRIGTSGKNTGAKSVARFIGSTDPPINSGFGEDSGYQAYYFDIQSSGYNLATGTDAATAPDPGNTSTVVLNAGVYQIGKK